MKLFEAVVEANHRAMAGDATAGLRPAEFADALPVAALTCIDARLNPLLPEVLGLPKEEFIWLRNAGNIITSSLSSTVRSLSLACAVKGAREIAIIGHTDCRVRQMTVMELTSRFQKIGILRSLLPENINEYFGLFASESQNVIRGVEWVRKSPIIGPHIPVHGLLVDIQTGKLDWIVNGYRVLETAASAAVAPEQTRELGDEVTLKLGDFKIASIPFPEAKIGAVVTDAVNWLSQVQTLSPERFTSAIPTSTASARSATEEAKPMRIPLPPPIRPQPPPLKTKKR